MSEITAMSSSADSTNITPASLHGVPDALLTRSGSVHAAVSEGGLADTAATRQKFKDLTASRVTRTRRLLMLQNGRKM